MAVAVPFLAFFVGFLLAWFLFTCSPRGKRWVKNILADPPPPLRDRLRAIFSYGLSWVPMGSKIRMAGILAYSKGRTLYRKLRFRRVGPARDFLELGELLRKQGFLRMALEKFAVAIEKAPLDPEAYLNRAKVYRQLDDPVRARRDLRTALVLPNDRVDRNMELQANLLEVNIELGEPEQALRHAFQYLYGLHTGRIPQPDLVRNPRKDAETLAIYIKAHDAVAETLINHQGDFDSALALFRRKKKFQALFRRTFRLENLPVLFLPEDWVRQIGHMALLDFWAKMKHLGWIDAQHLVVVAPPERTANLHYLKYLRSQMTFVTDPHLVGYLQHLANALGSNVASALDLPGGMVQYFCEGMGVIQEAWENEGRPPLLEVRPGDHRRARRTFEKWGIPPDAWFVAFHVRSPGFHREGDNPHQAHRNARIQSYLPAMEEVVRRGGWVIRLGDPTMDPLPPMEGVVDYAHSPDKSPEMDIYLCSACRFFVGVASGLSHVPTTFGVPCALTNWVSNTFPVYSRHDLFLPKLRKFRTENRLLSFPEFMRPETRILSYSQPKMSERDIDAVDNSPEEIRELVSEMLDRVEGRLHYTEEDEALQAQFRAQAVANGLVGFSRIGRDFLARYRHLLEEVPALRQAG